MPHSAPDPAPSVVDTQREQNTEVQSDLDYLDPQTRLLLKEDDNRTLHKALVGAVLLHVILLIITFPNLAEPRLPRATGPKQVYVVQQVRFQPPPAAQKKEIPKRRTKKIPIPDPTPDEPEPLEIEELPEPAEVCVSEIVCILANLAC